MKKHFIVAGITLMALVLIITVLLLMPELNLFNSVSVSRVEVDIQKDILLDFPDAVVSIDTWGRDYVEVSYDNMYRGKKELNINSTDNRITLNSKLDFSDFRHLDVKVPKGVVHIHAAVVDAKGGTYKTFNAQKGSLRYCELTDGYSVLGDAEIDLRECKLSGNGTIRSGWIQMRECDIGKLVLSPARDNSDLQVNLRAVSGLHIQLDAKNSTHLNAEFKDTGLDNLKVDCSGKSGSITLFNCDIKEVQNNSLIEIKTQKNVIR